MVPLPWMARLLDADGGQLRTLNRVQAVPISIDDSG